MLVTVLSCFCVFCFAQLFREVLRCNTRSIYKTCDSPGIVAIACFPVMYGGLWVLFTEVLSLLFHEIKNLVVWQKVVLSVMQKKRLRMTALHCELMTSSTVDLGMNHASNHGWVNVTPHPVHCKGSGSSKLLALCFVFWAAWPKKQLRFCN